MRFLTIVYFTNQGETCQHEVILTTIAWINILAKNSVILPDASTWKDEENIFLLKKERNWKSDIALNKISKEKGEGIKNFQ